MRSGKPSLRVYGQADTPDPADLAPLLAALPEGAGTVDGNTLDIDHEGHFFDPDDFLAAAEAAQARGLCGHLDVFDEQDRVLSRHEFGPDGHQLKRLRYDDILEHTKAEGNW